MIDDQIGCKLGQVMVSTTENRGHDVEFGPQRQQKKLWEFLLKQTRISDSRQRLSETKFIL